MKIKKKNRYISNVNAYIFQIYLFDYIIYYDIQPISTENIVHIHVAGIQ